MTVLYSSHNNDLFCHFVKTQSIKAGGAAGHMGAKESVKFSESI